MKKCRECGVELVVGVNWTTTKSQRKDYLCQDCTKVYNQEYRKKHRERILLQKRAYRQTHSKKIAEGKRNWKMRNSERETKRKRDWKKTPKGKALVRKHTNLRRARKVGAIIGTVDEATVFERDGCCVYCGSGQDLQLDHVEPLSQGGEHSNDNLVVSCQKCNDNKGVTPLIVWLLKRSDNDKRQSRRCDRWAIR